MPPTSCAQQKHNHLCMLRAALHASPGSRRPVTHVSFVSVMLQVWRLMLQLRWVRRRVGAQAVAHRVSAAANSLASRDAQEASEVAAAAAAQAAAAAAEWQAGSRAGLRSTSSFGTGSPVVGGSNSFSRQQGRVGAAGAAGPAAAAAGVSAEWLSGKEELLLLQEMWHCLSCWHGYILNGIRVKAWERLEQVGGAGRCLRACVHVLSQAAASN
jgi:hypothetical protein